MSENLPHPNPLPEGEGAKPEADLYRGIHEVLVSARTKARRAVNEAMVQAYWQIGRLIVEDEQQGSVRAAYGKRVLPEVAERLTTEFGKGFSLTNLKLFRQFYLAFPIGHTLCDQLSHSPLSWSHFRQVLRISNPVARDWYVTEAIAQGWSVRALDRQIGTLFYERLLLSQQKDGVRQEAVVNVGRVSVSVTRRFAPCRVTAAPNPTYGTKQGVTG